MCAFHATDSSPANDEAGFASPFLTQVILSSADQQFPLRPLVDTGSSPHNIIHERLAPAVCQRLGLEPIRLAKKKLVQGFDGVVRKKPITHAIYPTMSMGKHRETTVPFLITDVGYHDAILGKTWMNKNRVLLDLGNDSIMFPERQPVPSAPPPSTKLKILPRPSPRPNEDVFSIHSIGAAAFHLLARRPKSDNIQIFAMSMEDINTQLGFFRDQEAEVVSLSAVEPANQNMEDVKNKLPAEYHEFLDVFDRSKADQLPPHRSYDHKIELNGDSRPPQTRAYRMSPYKLQKVKEYLNENLSKGFITPSQAPYSSPVLFALKANGDLRFCVDYRKLNAITKRNRYPLPLIEEVIGKLVGCKHLTRLDIIAAFNKLRMHPDSEDLTTFITALGSYKYHVLPFGLTNGPSTFQQYINDVLWDYLNEFCQAYLDDILIYSKTRKEHRQHVSKVLSRLREAGLQVDIKKCEFDVQETAFLGVIVSGQGLRMDPHKVEAVVNWRTPSNLKEVQGFVGFANFYRRFIKDFSKLVKPLVALTRKDTPFLWSPECSQAFESVKQQVTAAPVLRHFDPKRQAILETDASDYVTGGVLSQFDDDHILHPVAFYSRSMVPAECNYHIYDKELLAIIRCFEHWRPELEGTDLPIQIFTDHQALKTFMESKELTRRQARYLDILSEFNFQIVFRPGRNNGKADALTRMPDSLPAGPHDERSKHQHQVILTPDRVQIRVNAIEESLFNRVHKANRGDPQCEEYRQAIQKGERTLHGTDLGRCRVIDGALFKNGLLWVPPCMHVEVLKEIHDQPASNHPGVTRMIDLLRRHYYWPGHTKTIKRYIRNCHPCQRSKAPRDQANGLLDPLPIPKQRWRDIAMDFITGLPESDGFNAICTLICRLSKERHYVPCHWGEGGTSTEETLWILLWNVFRLHGLPFSITSDRGRQFVSTLWKALCERLGIKSNLSTAFHPETDGQSERANQDIKRGLRTYCNYMQDDWARWIPMLEFADNDNLSTSLGLSPFYFNHGFHPRMSFSPDCNSYETTRERLQATKADDIAKRMEELLEYGRSQLLKSQSSMEAQANKHRKDVSYEIGDRVWLSSRNVKTTRPSKGLEDRQLGPFEVIEKVGSSYRLQMPSNWKQESVFHPKLLRPCANDPLPGQVAPPPKAHHFKRGDEWDVDDVIDSRRYRNRLQYKVKWSGEERDDHWYYADAGEFDNAKEIVEEFHRRYPKAIR